MGLNCGAKCAKYVLFVFNIIFFLGGAAILGVGIWVVVDTGSYNDFLKTVDPSGATTDVSNNILTNNVQYIKIVAYVLIGIGSFIFLLGFLGCCGAIKQWRPLLVTYAILLMLIMGVQIGLGVYVGVNKDTVVAKLKVEMKEWAKDYAYRETSVENGKLKIGPATGVLATDAKVIAATNGWNAMHVAFQCCGADSYRDFEASPYKPLNFQPPAFCCKMKDPAQLLLDNPVCVTAPSTTNSNQLKGCVQMVEKYMTDYAPALIGVAVGIGLIELIGIIFAFCLCCAIGDKGSRYN